MGVPSAALKRTSYVVALAALAVLFPQWLERVEASMQQECTHLSVEFNFRRPSDRNKAEAEQTSTAGLNAASSTGNVCCQTRHVSIQLQAANERAQGSTRSPRKWTISGQAQGQRARPAAVQGSPWRGEHRSRAPHASQTSRSLGHGTQHGVSAKGNSVCSGPSAARQGGSRRGMALAGRQGADAQAQRSRLNP